ncbi:class I SAM-dependent methyltransferase [Desertimonas flava]|uniref:class I SAM-dependent methyltransferase n=1 Tax=Desertimonas flava TaxID=2064846 RepID=UPI000E34EBA5|nr:methyltransferase domain-containing protein [Desertimonas flava]
MDDYWAEHFGAYHGGDDRLDASSDSFWWGYATTVLTEAGPLAGRTVLDAGFGSGAMLHLAAAAGATCTGIDLESAVAAFDDSHPSIDVEIGDLRDTAGWTVDRADVVWCVESIHFVDDPVETAYSLWARVAAGGRLVVTFADSRSPLIEKVRLDHGGRYHGVHPGALDALGRNLPACARFEIRDLRIDADQIVRPFRIGPHDPTARPPHRLLFTALKGA